jgi:hypothetical protein
MNNLITNKTAGLVVAILGLSLSFSAVSADDVNWDTKRAEMKAKFDADGDGKLSDTERQSAREAHKQKRLERLDTDNDGQVSEAERSVAKEKHRAKMMERFDSDGDGALNDAERQALKEKHRQKAMKRFDVDGDGQLNESERETAKKAREKFREHRATERDS